MTAHTHDIGPTARTGPVVEPARRIWPWEFGVVVGAAGLTIAAIFVAVGPAELAAGAAAVVVLVWWVRLLVRRDARSVVALWVAFLFTQPVAVLLPPALEVWALRVDDLALGIALVVVLATGLQRRDLRLPGRLVTLGFAGYAVCGVLGAWLSEVRLTTVILGTWLAVKLVVCLLVTEQFSWTSRDVTVARRVFLAVLGLVLAVAALQVLQPEFVNALLGRDVRSRVGLTVLTSIFPQPFLYSTVMLLATCLLISKAPARPGRLALSLVVAGFAVLSLRLKALISIILVVVTRVLTSPNSRIRAWTPIVVLVLVTAGLVLGSDLVEARLDVLFGDANPSPRQLLYGTAWLIAAARFPLGSGFGTFGSEASRWDYSPIYAEYGLSDHYGFRQAQPIFITDASWATVLGEAGWLGAASFAVALGALAVRVLRRVPAMASLGGEQPTRAALLFLVVFALSSVASPQLFSGFACLSLAVLVSMSESAARQAETLDDSTREAVHAPA